MYKYRGNNQRQSADIGTIYLTTILKKQGKFFRKLQIRDGIVTHEKEQAYTTQGYRKCQFKMC